MLMVLAAGSNISVIVSIGVDVHDVVVGGLWIPSNIFECVQYLAVNNRQYLAVVVIHTYICTPYA